MSDTIPTDANAAAIAVIGDRVRELDADILRHQAAIDTATASRAELLDVIAALSRKPRARKARAEPATANVLELPTPVASIFAPVVVAEPAEAA